MRQSKKARAGARDTEEVCMGEQDRERASKESGIEREREGERGRERECV